MITCFINEIHDNWDEDLNLLSLAYNTAVHSTTKYSPYELMYGRKPKMPLDLIYRHPVIYVPVTQDEYADQIKQSLLKAFEKVKRNREIRIRKIKLNYDRNVVAAKFKPGDLVWVHNDVIKKGQCKKFTYSWNGPYVVEQELNKVNYKIRPIKSKSKRLIVHINRLKRHYGKYDELTVDVHESPTKIVKERSKSLSEDDNSSEDETFKPEGVLKKLAKSNDLKPMDSVGKRLTKPPERLNYKFK
ncbi:unnamed protein product [Brachionus calyciflorus]|uniref:Integrase p58-like C-terminal domain-containing protein n=1 Tax=Brachionus calyciflorus TaxID=104777 RepID=A0A814A2E1_9BILA|nr:unnamed protein product [Brachionus calyciflorus]